MVVDCSRCRGESSRSRAAVSWNDTRDARQSRRRQRRRLWRRWWRRRRLRQRQEGETTTTTAAVATRLIFWTAWNKSGECGDDIDAAYPMGVVAKKKTRRHEARCDSRHRIEPRARFGRRPVGRRRCSTSRIVVVEMSGRLAMTSGWRFCVSRRSRSNSTLTPTTTTMTAAMTTLTPFDCDLVTSAATRSRARG